MVRGQPKAVSVGHGRLSQYHKCARSTVVPGHAGKSRMELREKAALSSQSPFRCLGSREMWEVERKVGGLSAAFYKATCCRETASHGSRQHSYSSHQ